MIITQELVIQVRELQDRIGRLFIADENCC